MESIEPQAAAEQPWPATPVCTVQLTAVFGVPVTVAKNCCVESAPAEEGRNAYTGEIVTAVCCAGEMVSNALALLLASASLTAVTATGFAAGVVAGAR